MKIPRPAWLSFMPGISMLLLVACQSVTPSPKVIDSRYLDSLASVFDTITTDSALYFTRLDKGRNPLPEDGAVRQWLQQYLLYQYYYYHRHDDNKALVHADSMMTIAGTIDEARLRNALAPRALLLEANVFLAQNLFAPAFEKIVEARQRMDRSPDSSLFTDYWQTMVCAAYNQERYTQAIDYLRQLAFFERRCSQQKDFRHIRHLQGILDNTGICYAKLGNADSALACYDTAISLLHNAQRQFPENLHFLSTAEAIVHGNRGDAFLLKGDSAAAEKNWRLDIQTNAHPDGEPEDALFSMLKLGNLYLLQSRLPELRSLLDSATLALDTIPNPELFDRWLYLTYSLDSAQGRWREAALAARKRHLLQDSITSVKLRRDAVNMDTAMAVIARNAKLPLLEKQNRIHSSLIAILLLAISLAIVILLLIIRQYKQSRKNLRTLQNNLTALQNSQDTNSRIMKIVAHDLRNPVASMTAMAEMLVKMPPSADQTSQFLDHIHTAGQHALQLITDMLECHAGASAFTTSPVDLKDMLEHCIMLLKHKWDLKHQQVIFHGASVKITADREKLWRVFSNLLTNAIKFSPAGKDIAIHLSTDRTHALVMIQDQGIGIPPSLQEKIFTPAAKRKGTAGEPTFGLGLMICRQIVELHQGSIWFESEEGKGSRFFVKLPIN